MFDTPSKPARQVSALLFSLLVTVLTRNVLADDVRAGPRVDSARPSAGSGGSALQPTFSNGQTWSSPLPPRPLSSSGRLEDGVRSDVDRLNQRLADDNPRDDRPSSWLGLGSGDCNYSVTPGRYERGAREAASSFRCTR